MHFFSSLYLEKRSLIRYKRPLFLFALYRYLRFFQLKSIKVFKWRDTVIELK